MIEIMFRVMQICLFDTWFLTKTEFGERFLHWVSRSCESCITGPGGRKSYSMGGEVL